MILVGLNASAIEYGLVNTLPTVVIPPPPPPPTHITASTLGPRGRNIGPVKALRGLGLDAGIQSGLTIIGALAFAYFALTILAISKSVEKRERR